MDSNDIFDTYSLLSRWIGFIGMIYGSWVKSFTRKEKKRNCPSKSIY